MISILLLRYVNAILKSIEVGSMLRPALYCESEFVIGADLKGLYFPWLAAVSVKRHVARCTYMVHLLYKQNYIAPSAG